MLHDLALEGLLDLHVELHEHHVAGVAPDQHSTLPRHDGVVQKEDDEHDEVQNVEGHVPEERPPGEVEHLPGEERTHSNDEKDVEDSRAHDCPNAHIAMGDEDTNQRGEEFWGRTTGGHEGCPGNVVRNLQLVRDNSQSGNKELITHDGQSHKHVYHPKDVEDHPPSPPVFYREDVLWILCLYMGDVWTNSYFGSSGNSGGGRCGRCRS